MGVKMKKNVRQNLIYVILSILIILMVYILYQCAVLLRKPTNSVLIRNGRLTNYEEVVGYIIREEDVIDTSAYTGERQLVIDDANRVSKNEIIASYISSEEDTLKKRISELDVEIQEIMETQLLDFSADVKSIESEIQKKIYIIKEKRNNFYELTQLKKDINRCLEKKASIVGELSPTGSKLNKLIEERMNCEKKLNSARRDLHAENTGLVSYRIDGYENVLSPSVFSKLTIEELEKIKIGVNQQIPISEDKVKIVNNFFVYLAVPMNSEESKRLKVNDTLKISFTGDFTNYEKATIVYILEEGDRRLVILKTTSNTEKLTQYRKVSFDIVWWNYEGLKVPMNAIYDKEIKNEITGEVYARLKAIKLEEAGYQKEVWVKVDNFVEDFAIIENYQDEELLDMGVPENLVDERNKVSMYDEVLLN